jgi:hypothetical protein
MMENQIATPISPSVRGQISGPPGHFLVGNIQDFRRDQSGSRSTGGNRSVCHPAT